MDILWLKNPYYNGNGIFTKDCVNAPVLNNLLSNLIYSTKSNSSYS